jgi:hypothetical protein
LSLIVTFLMATAETPGLYSITLSTSKKGNLKAEQTWMIHRTEQNKTKNIPSFVELSWVTLPMR